MTEYEDYKKLLQEHPLTRYIKKVHPVVTKANATAITVEFAELGRSDFDTDFIATGVSVACPDDVFDPRMGKVVAMHHALQQALNWYHREKVYHPRARHYRRTVPLY